MQFKDYFTLAISLTALGVSLYNFYTQQLRRKEKLIGSLISIGVNSGKFDRKMEYIISNTGDVQLVVKEAEVLTSEEGILKTNTKELPVVLKPGEIALLNVLYKSTDTKKGSKMTVEMGVFSTSGKGYRLNHEHGENAWNIFELEQKHEGY